MIELLSTMTLTEIILIIFGILVALKEGIALLEYFYDKLKTLFDKNYKKENSTQEIINKLNGLETEAKKRSKEKEELSQEIQGVKDYFAEQLNEQNKNFNEKFEAQEKKLELLTESDKDDIRGWIVEKYHYYSKQGEIDDFTMDSILKRYNHYKAEGGNSYITGLVEKLQKLQK